MSLNRSDILGTVEKNKKENDERCARDYLESMFNAKDVELNKELFDAIEKRVKTLKGAISSITNKINTVWDSSFFNTHDDLVNLNSKIPEDLTIDIKTRIEEASMMSHEKYLGDYDTNTKSIDENIKSIDELITEYNNLDSKRSRARSNENRALPGLEKEKYKRERQSLERQMDTVKSTITSNVSPIENLNSLNKTLLDNGLQKGGV